MNDLEHPKPQKKGNRLLNGCMTTLGAVVMLVLVLNFFQNVIRNIRGTFDPRIAEHNRMHSVVDDFMDNTKNNDLQKACANLESKVASLSCQNALRLLRNQHKNLFTDFSNVRGSSVEFLEDSNLALLSGDLGYPGPPTGYFDALFVREGDEWQIRAITACMEDHFDEVSQCFELDPFDNLVVD